jgi:hypothetical protein
MHLRARESVCECVRFWVRCSCNALCLEHLYVEVDERSYCEDLAHLAGPFDGKRVQNANHL